MPRSDIEFISPSSLDKLNGILQFFQSDQGKVAGRWKEQTLYYRFSDSFTVGSELPNATPGSGWTGAEQKAVRTALNEISQYIPLTFIEATDNETASLNFYLHQDSSSSTGDFRGLGYGPGFVRRGVISFNELGNGWYDFDLGGQGYNTILHEISHALGLDHPFAGDISPGIAPSDLLYTVMAYPLEEAPTSYGSTATLSPLDIAALQYLYGVGNELNTGNDVYEIRSVHVSPTETFYSAIYDSNGVDTISAAGINQSVSINLNSYALDSSSRSEYSDIFSGVFSRFQYERNFLSSVTDRNNLVDIPGGYTISPNTLIENAIGWNYNDFLLGNEIGNHLRGGAGKDHLFGLEGHDTLRGESDDDYLHGGSGNDLLVGGGGKDRLIGASGFDTAQIRGQTVNITNFSVSNGGIISTHNGVEHFEILGSLNSDTIRLASASGISSSFIESFSGSDVIFDSPVNDRILSGLDDDRIEILGGLDTVDGGGGIDTLILRTNSFVAPSATNGVVSTLNGIIAFQSIEKFEVVTSSTSSNSISYINSITPITVTGGNASDDLRGGSANDSLLGLSGNDYLHGYDGRDSLRGDAGADTLLGGSGNDSLWGGSNNDILRGGSDSDSLFGEAGADFLEGGGHNDCLYGEESDDRLYGDWVSTLITVDNGNDTLDGGEGNDTLAGRGGHDYLLGRSGGDFLYGDRGHDSLSGGSGNDYLSGGDGLDSLFEQNLSTATLTNTFLSGSAGADTLVSIEHAELRGNAAHNILDARSFSAGTVNLKGDFGNDTLRGGGSHDYLDGGNHKDFLFGNSGNDSLSGSYDNDTLSGGFGNDKIDGGDGIDWLRETGNFNYRLTNTALTGGLGTDTLLSIERASLTGGSSSNSINAGKVGFGAVQLQGGGGDDTLIGGSRNDVLDGGNQNDYINGGSGSDTLSGGNGNDILQGNYGQDRIDGGFGIDLLQEAGDSNFVLSNTRLASKFGRDTLVGIERASLRGGAGDNSLAAADFSLGKVFLYGERGDDSIQGGRYGDLLNGGDGEDVIWGGPGHDDIRGNDHGDLLLGQLGRDTLRGDLGNDDLYGGPQTDRLYGGYGNDSLNGQEGNDTLWGGSGRDTLMGGTGHDRLYGGEGADKFFWEGGNDFLDGGTGFDALVIYGEGNYTLKNDRLITSKGTDTLESIEAVTLITQSNTNDLLNASAFSNYGLSLTSGLGHDTLRGGTKNDTLSGGRGNNFLQGGAGIDLASFSDDSDFVLSDALLVSDLGRTTLEGIERVNISLISDSHVLDARNYSSGPVILEGGKGRDTLLGSGSSDTLRGGKGNDTIKGGAGFDYVEGQEGNDFIGGERGNDLLKGGAGNDTLLGGDGQDRIFGEWEAPRSESGNDFIDGGKGNDTLSGREGNDELHGSEGNDRLGGGNGNDLLMGGSQADTLSGGHDRDTLHGDDGNDLLDGQSDNDWLKGGAGSDVLLGGEGNDRLYGEWLAYGATIDPNAGNDTLRGGSGDDTILGRDGRDSLVGDNGNDLLEGNRGNDKLLGGAGNDTLKGGEGHDILIGFQNANSSINTRDRLIGGAGRDRFYASNSYRNFALVEDFSTVDDIIVLEERYRNQYQLGAAYIEGARGNCIYRDINLNGTFDQGDTYVIYVRGYMSINAVSSLNLSAEYFNFR